MIPFCPPLKNKELSHPLARMSNHIFRAPFRQKKTPAVMVVKTKKIRRTNVVDEIHMRQRCNSSACCATVQTSSNKQQLCTNRQLSIRQLEKIAHIILQQCGWRLRRRLFLCFSPNDTEKRPSKGRYNGQSSAMLVRW